MANRNKWMNHFINMSKSANKSKFYLVKNQQPVKLEITSQSQDAVNRAKEIMKNDNHDSSVKVKKPRKPKIKRESSKKNSVKKDKSLTRNPSKNKRSRPSKSDKSKLSKVSKNKKLKSIKGSRKKQTKNSEVTVFESV